MLLGYDITYPQIIGYIILGYILVDLIIFLFNAGQNTGNGGCATKKMGIWIFC